MVKKNKLVDNKELREEIIKSKEQDELTERALELLYKLALEAQRKMHYRCEDDRQECLQSALIDLWKYWRSYDPQYKNAFAYYTSIAYNGMGKGYKRLYRDKEKGTISYSDSKDGDGIYSV